MNEEPTYLNLTPNFRVFRCDDRNLEVEEFRTVVARRGKHVKESKRETEKWVSIGYYSTLPQAVNGVLTECANSLTVSEKMELKDVLSELQGLTSELKTAVENSGIKLTDFTKVPDGRGRKPKEVTVAKVKEKSNKSVPKKKVRGRPRKTANRS